MCSYSGYADLASCASTTRSHRIAIAMRARSSPSYDHARRWTGDWLRSRRVLSQLGPHSPAPARQTFPPIWEITHEESHCVDARERTISPPAPVCSRPSWISRLTHARFGGTQRRRPAQGRGARVAPSRTTFEIFPALGRRRARVVINNPRGRTPRAPSRR